MNNIIGSNHTNINIVVNNNEPNSVDNINDPSNVTNIIVNNINDPTQGYGDPMKGFFRNVNNNKFKSRDGLLAPTCI